MELRKGKDITIFATGLCVSETLKAAETLAADGTSRSKVHPRVSGVLLQDDAAGIRAVGSSPRERGFVKERVDELEDQGFIPA